MSWLIDHSSMGDKTTLHMIDNTAGILIGAGCHPDSYQERHKQIVSVAISGRAAISFLYQKVAYLECTSKGGSAHDFY